MPWLFLSGGEDAFLVVADATHHKLLLVPNRAPLVVRNYVFYARNRKPLAYARTLVDFLVFASGERDALDHLLHILRNVQLVASAPGACLLRSNRNAFVERSRIVRANFRTNAVFQRRNDLPTRGVVLRIGAEYKGNVKRQAHRISLNLHITFLHDVEQTHLNFAGEIGQLIDGKNASIGARQQPVVHRQFAAEFMPAACSFNGIDIADQIRNRDIGSRQLFYVAILGSEISDGRAVAVLGDFLMAAAADGGIRVVMDLAGGDVRHLRGKQRCKGAKDPAFCLSTQAQQTEIVARENSVDDLRYDSVFIPHNSRKKRATLAQFADKIVAELILYTAGKETLFGEWTLAKFAERPRETHGDNPQGKTAFLT